MAEENQAPEVNAPAKEKMFSKIGLVVFAVTMALWTGLLIFLTQGEAGKADEGSKRAGSGSKEAIIACKRLLLEQNKVKAFKVKNITVQINYDKTGTQGKVLRCAFSFKLGLTKIEEKSVEVEHWPPDKKDENKFGDEMGKGDDTNPYDLTWSLEKEIMGDPAGDANSGSYFSALENSEDEIRGMIINILNTTMYSSLNDVNSRHQIAERLKLNVNEKLHALGLYKRVNKVTWIEFTFP